MKKMIKFLSLAAVLFFICTSFKFVVNPELEIGKAIPDAGLKMMDISGKEISLTEVKRENGLLVIFSCNTCPYVKLSEARIKEMATLAKRT